jgi:fatty acid desaturase
VHHGRASDENSRRVDFCAAVLHLAGSRPASGAGSEIRPLFRGPNSAYFGAVATATKLQTLISTMQESFFNDVRRSDLVDESGVAYSAFRKQLVPHWRTVWTHIALGWLALIAINAVLILASHRNVVFDLVLIVAGAAALGFVIAFLILFMHEAAHYNLHPQRERNDLLCNLFVSGVIGHDVRRYRPIHWDHHRFIGTTNDTEITYFDSLNVRLLLESVCGIRVLKVLAARKRMAVEKKEAATAATTPEMQRAPQYVLLGGIAANACYVTVLAYFHQWVTLLAWCGGVVVFYPFFGAVRQLLEHRSADADSAIDYHSVDHGVSNRIFGDGLLARTLGGAGFNRHLLHHWDPSVSYTRLRDVEGFLMRTSHRAALDKHRTTYGETFRQLFVWK